MQDITNKSLTVQSVDETEKSVRVKLRDQDDPHSDILWCYASKRTFSKDDFTEGDEQVATLNWVPDKNDATKGFFGVKKWGEKADTPQPRAGGPGRPFTPKSPGDIAVMQGCTLATASASVVGTLLTMGAIKNTDDALKALETVHNKLTDLSVSAIGKLKGAVA